MAPSIKTQVTEALRKVAAPMIATLLVHTGLHAQEMIVRRPLLTAGPIDRLVKRTEVKEIIFKPLQKTGLHLHPCPVVGYIAEGKAIVQVKGGALQTLKAGDAFYEPANTEMLHFDNASAKEPLRFICFYLINDENKIIKMLPENK